MKKELFLSVLITLVYNFNFYVHFLLLHFVCLFAVVYMYIFIYLLLFFMDFDIAIPYLLCPFLSPLSLRSQR